MLPYLADQLLWPLALVDIVLNDEFVLVEVEVGSLPIAVDCDCPGKVGRVHTHSRLLFLRPATGVSGHASLSDSDDESLLSPA